jgi:hypothetical protein
MAKHIALTWIRTSPSSRGPVALAVLSIPGKTSKAISKGAAELLPPVTSPENPSEFAAEYLGSPVG